MQIDRARFLLLTASLAGGGCSANPPVEPVPQPEPTSTGTEIVVAETPEPADPVVPVASVAVSSTPTAEPVTPVPPPSGACDNDTATVPACSISAPPGPVCESFSDAKSSCKSYKTGLRGAVAARAIACLNAASGTPDICDYTKSEACATAAIRTACIQPSTFNACSPVVSMCAGYSWSKLNMQDCQQMLSSVKDGKRGAMITCMTEGCSLDSCTYALR